MNIKCNAHQWAVLKNALADYTEKLRNRLLREERTPMQSGVSISKIRRGLALASTLDMSVRLAVPDDPADFLDDEEKMRDFFALTKEAFLFSYSYLTEAEYDITARKLKFVPVCKSCNSGGCTCRAKEPYNGEDDA